MKKISYRKFEHIILPHFRQQLNEAESAQDIRNTFVSSIRHLFESAFAGRVSIEDEDLRFTPSEEPYFFLSRAVLKEEPLRSIWKDSDLRHVMERLAESAMNRYKHLGKHGEKTEAKIRMNFFR